MKSCAFFSVIAAVSFGSYAAGFGHGEVFGHGHSHAYGHGHLHVPTYTHHQRHSLPLIQTVHHGASIAHGNEYAARGDLLGLHSFGFHGVSLGHSVSHDHLLPAYAGHSIEFPLGYGLPQRSKLYGGYVGGFGGYARGALESIQHLHQGNLKLQAPLLGYESHKAAGHGPFGHATHMSLGYYGGQPGVSGIGGAHYGLEYKKAKA